MSTNYGLSYDDLLTVRTKIKNQEKYLEENSFITSTGQEKTLLDVSYSANLSERYFPRLLNKVHTFVSLNTSRDYVPVFLTVTLDGFFRDFMKGDYSRWTPELRKKYEDHIPNNDRNGHYLDMIDQKEILTSKDLYKILSHQLFRFVRSYALQNIRKNDDDYSFIRVTEPHKDGVPHFHILMYFPEQYLESVYHAFHRFFPAPRNSKKITPRDGGRYANKIGDSWYETQGFQTEIRSPAGYILKYILKSFRNLVEEKEIDYLQAWYVHNKIPRIITTHTLIPQDIYHKTSMLDDDWYYLTNIKLLDGYTCERDIHFFKFDDGLGRVIIGDDGLYRIFNNGKLVKSIGVKQYRPKRVRLRSLSFSVEKPSTFNIFTKYEFFIPPKPYSYYRITLYSDGTQFCFGSVNDFFLTFDHEYYEPSFIDKPISRLSDLELFESYQSFDHTIGDPKRFGLIRNECIRRGLLGGEIVSLNDYMFESVRIMRMLNELE